MTSLYLLSNCKTILLNCKMRMFCFPLYTPVGGNWGATPLYTAVAGLTSSGTSRPRQSLQVHRSVLNTFERQIESGIDSSSSGVTKKPPPVPKLPSIAKVRRMARLTAIVRILTMLKSEIKITWMSEMLLKRIWTPETKMIALHARSRRWLPTRETWITDWRFCYFFISLCFRLRIGLVFWLTGFHGT